MINERELKHPYFSNVTSKMILLEVSDYNRGGWKLLIPKRHF